MSARKLDPSLIVLLVVSAGVFFVLPPLAWGSVSGLLEHPARLGLYLVLIVGLVAFLFTGMDFSSLKWDDPTTRKVIPLAVAVTLPFAFLPVYADRHDFMVLDCDWARYTGLVLYGVGCLLRIGPMFQLRNRFRAPWTAQEQHYLVTTGFYRYIRHPSYLGVLVASLGWFLIFRCWIGFVLCLLLIPTAIPAIRREESKLRDEFGEPYLAYQRRTWILPFLR
jgi:protein-S-isoprenylcysteine O-methyltransferase Ste14